MDNFWEKTKLFFGLAIGFLLFELFMIFCYFGLIENPDLIYYLMIYSPILLSLLFCLLTISFGIKSLKSGEKKSLYLIIISAILSLLYIFIIVMQVLESNNIL
jgi:hypothetical protein